MVVEASQYCLSAHCSATSSVGAVADATEFRGVKGAVPPRSRLCRAGARSILSHLALLPQTLVTHQSLYHPSFLFPSSPSLPSSAPLLLPGLPTQPPTNLFIDHERHTSPGQDPHCVGGQSLVEPAQAFRGVGPRNAIGDRGVGWGVDGLVLFGGGGREKGVK